MSSTSSSSASSNEPSKRIAYAMRAMYAAANLTKEISGKKDQKKALEGIQTKLPSQSIVPNNESLDKINSAINQNQHDIDSLEKKLHIAEKDVVRYFQDAIDEICKRSVREGDARVESVFRRKLTEADHSFQRKTEEIKSDINALRNTKMNIEEGNRIVTEMNNETRSQLTSLLLEQVEGLRTQNKAAFTELRNKYIQLSSTNYKDQLRADVTRDVVEYVKQQFRPEELHAIQTQVMQILEQSRRSAPSAATTSLDPEQYTELIQSEIQKHAQDKDTLQKQLDELDEWNKMKNKMKDLSNKIGKEPSPVLQNLQNDLGQLHQKLDSIKKQVDTITNKSTTPEAQEREVSILDRRLRDVQRDLAVNSSQLEMTQTWDAFNETESARLKNHQRPEREDGSIEGERQRKRQRADNDRDAHHQYQNGTITIDDTQLDEKIKALEQKQNSLIEYLDTFRNNILNPEFPGRLQSTMTDIEMVLRSHEEFIAHLVDPIRAEQSGTVDLTSSNNSAMQIPQILSPAMIQAIQAVVKNTAEQTAKPLLKRIATLESKLSQRNN